jgi:hypothetical protein
MGGGLHRTKLTFALQRLPPRAQVCAVTASPKFHIALARISGESAIHSQEYYDLRGILAPIGDA